MRNRVKGIDPQRCEVFIFHPTYGFQTIIYNYLRPRKYSNISDKVKHEFWQPASHTSASTVPGRFGTLPEDGSHAEAGSLKPHIIKVEEVERISRLILETSRSRSDYTDWVAKLYEVFTDQFPDEYSIANTLIEMKHGVKEFLPQMSDLKQSIGSNYLKIKFGIQPFLNDLKSSVQLYGKFKSRLKFLKENRLEFVDRKRIESTESLYSGEIFSDECFWGPPPPPPPLPPIELDVHHPFKQMYAEEWAEAKHVATAFINNQIEDLDNVGRQVAAMAGMAGLANPTRVAWNAIPWTWLSDWFIDIDSMLEPLEIQPFEGKLSLNKAFISSRLRSYGHVYTIGRDCGITASNEDWDKLLIRRYERSEELEISDSFISPRLIVPSLTGSQEAILLALLQQRCMAIPNVQKLLKRYRKP